uniref:C-type lectin domain-containing protein n=1 Tax=Branchiostoma floridae TaxID=7739 RepID=C3ZY38_BRAFL|eukprot:XP_002586509.1 hypothetical protein BRAFLDRAFT_106412 [Branchiostoma floridae]
MAITSSRRNWDQAEARCVSYGPYGGHLARITSSTQQHLLTDMALGHSGTHYWIGCTDRQIEGIWRWSDGSSLSYTNWAPTQPDNADGIQDCGILYSIYGYAQWDDTECSTPYFFICQTDINECSNDNGGCSHNCENTDGSYRCTCQDGYQLSGLTDCRDINECSNDNGGCSHNCKNTDGSYRCICQDGYQLSGLTDCRDGKKKASPSHLKLLKMLEQGNPFARYIRDWERKRCDSDLRFYLEIYNNSTCTGERRVGASESDIQETVKMLHKLQIFKVSGTDLLPLGDSEQSMINWSLDYRKSLHSQQRIAVTVNETRFCITQAYRVRQYYVQIQHDFLANVEPISQCSLLNLLTKSKMKYELPVVLISINTESDKQDGNITHLCKHAWKDAGGNFALGQTAILRIVPICVDKHYNTQSVAVVLYDAEAGKHGNANYNEGYSRNVTTVFGHEEAMNVTCLLKTALGKTYQHVFTATSDTPECASCVKEKEIEHMEVREGTGNPEIENQTNPYTARTVTHDGPKGHEKSPLVGHEY